MGSLGLTSLNSGVIALLLLLSTTCTAQLSSTFYDSTCPNALTTIRTSIRTAVSRERRMAASLIRLHFHDCFVQGCDGSVLLKDSSAIPDSERNAIQNANSARGFEVIEAAKSEVEKICPGVVSCADVLAVAARDSSDLVGGPSWTVKLGRRDSTSSSRSQAEANLPRFTDSLAILISGFSNKGLNVRDLVALSGSHTVGQAQCVTFRARVNGNSSIDTGFASTRRRRCPADVTRENSTLAPLDLVTPVQFDNNYFMNLLDLKGLLASDQVLFSGGQTDSIVTEYSQSRSTFSNDFASAMIKMGDIDPLTGSSGQIRRVCDSVN